MIVKSILFFGQQATHACDGTCSKAWGHNSRPRVQVSSHADDELDEAPRDPSTYEGDDAKPIEVRGANDVNRWCVRECERAWMSPPDDPNARPALPDFSGRFYNIAPHRRTT